MRKVFCLMGKSNAGKDTMFRRLLAREELGLKPVISYTTRPIRACEQNGREYFFVPLSRIQAFERAGKLIERRDYRTACGVWTYCTVDDGQIQSGGMYLVITTLTAYKKLRAYYGEDSVVPLYLYVDDEERLRRAMRREKQQKRPDYEEMCRRFLADNYDFSSRRLKEAGIGYFYKNHQLTDCLTRLVRTIAQAKDE